MGNLGFIVVDYPPMLGGIARYTGDIVRFLAPLVAWRVYLRVTTPPAPWPEHPHHGCIDPQELHDHPDRIAARLQDDGVTHVLFNHIDLAGPRTVRAFRTRGIPCSVFLYGADINFHRSPRGHARLYATAALMKHRIVISEGTRRLVHRRLPLLGTQMITPGIEEGAPEVPGLGNRHGIIAVGRLVRRKGFDTLLEAAARLRREGFDVPVTFAGDGPDRDWLLARAAELGLAGQVTVRSGLTDEQIRAELQRHRVFCLLPRQLGNGDVEGFGIVFLEAAREGLPVVAGRSGGVPDAVDHEGNGFLVDPAGPGEAADRLRILLTDDATWRRQSERGLAWYRTFAWSRRDARREFAFLLDSPTTPPPHGRTP